MAKLLQYMGILICIAMILTGVYGIFIPASNIFSSFDPQEGAPYRLEYNDGRIELYRRWDISPYMEWSSKAAPFLVKYYTSLEDAAREASMLSDSERDTFLSNS